MLAHLLHGFILCNHGCSCARNGTHRRMMLLVTKVTEAKLILFYQRIFSLIFCKVLEFIIILRSLGLHTLAQCLPLPGYQSLFCFHFIHHQFSSFFQLVILTEAMLGCRYKYFRHFCFLQNCYV